MFLEFGLLTIVFLLAYANGANDIPKGVATLLGLGVGSLRTALVLATTGTLAGAWCATQVSRGLIQAFSGQGLVADGLASSPPFLGTVGLAAGLTVLLATRLGLPISTTHSLVGALLGAGFAAEGKLSSGPLAYTFLAPLTLSPLIGFLLTLALASAIRPLLRRNPLWDGSERSVCICWGGLSRVSAGVTQAAALLLQERERVVLGTVSEGNRTGGVKLIRVDRDSCLQLLHVTAAWSVGFARALNDAPKIASLLVVAPVFSGASVEAWLMWVGLVMGLGGILSCRRVAETLAFRITSFVPAGGIAASLVTAGLVILASVSGLPVSTTHVAIGSFVGAGFANGELRWNVVGRIGAAWLVSVPLAFVLSSLIALVVI